MTEELKQEDESFEETDIPLPDKTHGDKRSRNMRKNKQPAPLPKQNTASNIL